ncbi:unnamed protein product [Agarophyton chilense]
MSTAEPPQRANQVLNQYQQLREQIDRNYAKLAQLNSDRNEHDLVISQLQKLPPSTRCWHQVGAVLAEKRVSLVVPVLILTRDKLADTVRQLSHSISELEQNAQHLQKNISVPNASPLAPLP